MDAIELHCCWCDSPITRAMKVIIIKWFLPGDDILLDIACSFNCMQSTCSEWIPDNHGSILSIDTVRINN